MYVGIEQLEYIRGKVAGIFAFHYRVSLMGREGGGV
jgi:hypothetical protein